MRDADALRCTRLDSPVGPLTLAADAHGLRHIRFATNRHDVAGRERWTRGQSPLLDDAKRQLDDYFAGRRRSFDLLLAPMGTPFQLRAWHALASIPYGSTRSYGEQARAIGAPTSVRAVGAANGRNPLPIVLPCHRVIGADRSLTGFGGGLPIKATLLRLEGALPDEASVGGDLFAGA